MLSVKLRNAIKREKGSDGFEYHLKNIVLNGVKCGCSGFVANPKNGRVVYVNTEKGYVRKNLIRYARDIHDFTGGTNQFVSDKNIAQNVVRLLTSERQVLVRD